MTKCEKPPDTAERDLHVIVEEACPDCGGAGVVSHPIYDDLAKAVRVYDRDKLRPLSASDSGLGPSDISQRRCRFEDQWMAEHGYPGGMEHWPPEERQCDTCQGTGRRRFAMPIADLARHLGLSDPVDDCRVETRRTNGE